MNNFFSHNYTLHLPVGWRFAGRLVVVGLRPGGGAGGYHNGGLVAHLTYTGNRPLLPCHTSSSSCTARLSAVAGPVATGWGAPGPAVRGGARVGLSRRQVRRRRVGSGRGNNA